MICNKYTNWVIWPNKLVLISIVIFFLLHQNQTKFDRFYRNLLVSWFSDPSTYDLVVLCYHGLMHFGKTWEIPVLSDKQSAPFSMTTSYTLLYQCYGLGLMVSCTCGLMMLFLFSCSSVLIFLCLCDLILVILCSSDFPMNALWLILMLSLLWSCSCCPMVMLSWSCGLALWSHGHAIMILWSCLVVSWLCYHDLALVVPWSCDHDLVVLPCGLMIMLSWSYGLALVGSWSCYHDLALVVQ